MSSQRGSRVRAFAAKLRGLLSERRRDAEFDDEMQEHLRLLAERFEAQGMSKEEAAASARRQFGNATLLQEDRRELQTLPLIETLWHDLRYALRTLRKAPGFTIVAVLTLALGIGANTAIFTFVKSTLLQRLPVRADNRIVVIWVNNLKAGWSRIGPAGQDYLDWKEEQPKSFEDLFLFEHGSGTITGGGEPEQVAGLRVTTNFGDFFGIKPVLGRTFRVDEAAARHNNAVLAYRYWQGRYGSDPSVIGRSLTLNSESYTIIGVLPPELNTVFPIDVVVPFDNDWLKRAESDLGVFGRLKPGVTLKQASSEMSVIMQRIGGQRPSRIGYGSILVPLESVRMEYIRPALLVLLGAVGFVLLIACANVANLLLSRAVKRQREVAIRMALGGGRVRLMSQFLTESVLLAMLGGTAGLLLAFSSTYLWTKYMSVRIPVPNAADQVLLPRVHLDTAALAFTLILSLLTGIIFGLAPAFQSLRCNVNEFLKDGERGFAAGRRGQKTRAALVILESALAFVLVIGAGLVVESFSHLLATNPGFQPDHLLTLRIKLPNDAKDSPYRDPLKQQAAFQDFLTRVQALPRVDSAAFTEIVPLSQDDMDMGFFTVKDAPPLAPGVRLSADFRDVTPSFFQTMGIPLIQGRNFANQDNLQSPRIVVIDETFARHFFPNQNPIGRSLQFAGSVHPVREIIGVVGSVRDAGLDQQPRPTVYFPSLQSADQTMSLVVRTSLPPAAIIPAIKNAIWSVDANQPLFNIRPMSAILSEMTSAQRIASLVLGMFAFLALALATIGIYGVTSYVAGQKTHEIGIRTALGAQPSDVLRLVIGQGVRLAVCGVSIGLLASLALTRLMSSLLYGIGATDPPMFAGVTILLTLVALAACYIPARRAMRMDPLVALRYE
ncbi:MAG TPA: ABC transporter permease [Candidatus Acidoferrum sp.]